MHLPFLNASSQPDLEIIIPKRSEQLLNQTWQGFRELSRRHQIQIIIAVFLGFIVFDLGLATTILVSNGLVSFATSSDEESASTISTPEQPNAPPEETPGTDAKSAFINLQPTVNRWSSGIKAKVGLMIYDLDHNKVAAELNANQVFSTASIYKLFFAYVGYQDIDSGYMDPDRPFAITNDYRADTYTFSECLDLMIRESYNGCADPIRSNQRLYRRAEALIDSLELKNTTNGGLSSTPSDLASFLKFLYQNHDLSAESWANFQDSLLNQPPTKVGEKETYDWRQGLPTGFSEAVTVYDKVGWAWSDTGSYWTVYNDAAIVEFPDLNRHYIIVLLTTDLHEDPPVSLQKLGTELEATIRSGSENSK